MFGFFFFHLFICKELESLKPLSHWLDLKAIKKVTATGDKYATMCYDHIKDLESQSKVDNIAKLTENISDLSSYLLQELFFCFGTLF